MRRAALIMAIFLVTAPMSLTAQTGERPDSAKALRGSQAFRVYCGSCHGREAKGDGPLAADLHVKPANLTELSKRNGGTFPFDMVIETIEHGRKVRGHGSEEMPAWGDAFEMTEQTKDAARAKMEELAHFLWSIQVQ
ncbi:MAG TPA: c-type cytochrome [Vicinamibacteria bacterium]|nr:c-type cytochrome [Vicinamibacteria bacterium]